MGRLIDVTVPLSAGVPTVDQRLFEAPAGPARVVETAAGSGGAP